MENKDFVLRLRRTFEGESMADVARRLKIPHATVRNYYLGRLPAPEVLIKIANETSVSLNWLLAGTGDMFGGERPPMTLGKFVEERIVEIVDQRIAAHGGGMVTDLGTLDNSDVFDVEAAVLKLNDPQAVMSEWFAFEGREYPQDYGIEFFRGWETFSVEEKIAALDDAKRTLDRSL